MILIKIVGADGKTPNFKIGGVTTVSSSEPAKATITGDAENPVLNLWLPQGKDGSGGGSGLPAGNPYDFLILDSAGKPKWLSGFKEIIGISSTIDILSYSKIIVVDYNYIISIIKIHKKSVSLHL